MIEAKLFVDGEWVSGAGEVELLDKFTGAPVARVHTASRRQVEQATRAVATAQADDHCSPFQRYEYLRAAAELLVARADEFADMIITDTGFTVAEARLEVSRAEETLLLSAEEAKRITGEMVAIDAGRQHSKRVAFTVRAPLGVVCAITPFNSPLNTLLHKVAPALAAGNGVVIKPSGYTPLTATLLVGLLLDAGVPPGMLALVHGSGSTVGQWLLEDPVPQFYAFTGSTEVGAHIRATVGLRRTQLELGSLSSTIVCEDATLSRAVPRSLDSAFRKSGQVCTSVQRLYVHQAIADDFVAAAVKYLVGKSAADPRQLDTYLGPVISAADGDRIRRAVSDAVDGGAAVLSGDTRGTGTLLDPVVLTEVTPDMTVMSSEIFGPVVCIRRFRDLAEAIAEANDTPYGLSAGIFTNSIDNAFLAARQLRFGVVNINETSSARVDLMPFGGVKDSGSGKEGPHYAVREMTEERLITFQP